MNEEKLARLEAIDLARISGGGLDEVGVLTMPHSPGRRVLNADAGDDESVGTLPATDHFRLV